MMDKIKEYIELVMDKLGDKKWVVYVGLALVFCFLVIGLAQGAQAGGQNHNCQGGHNCNGGQGGQLSNTQGQAQGQSQGQHQSSVNTSNSVSKSQSRSRAVSDSHSSSNSGGNILSNSAGGGESSSTSSASGGRSNSTGGSAIINENYSASSAASVYAGYCQSGGSGQSEDGGFSVVNSDQFCDHIRAAEEMHKAYQREVAKCQCVGICSEAIASIELQCKDSEQAQYYLEAYHENLHDANQLVQYTQATGLIGRVSGQLAIPAALIAALFIL